MTANWKATIDSELPLLAEQRPIARSEPVTPANLTVAI
jgi:hypothetical protein